MLLILARSSQTRSLQDPHKQEVADPYKILTNKIPKKQEVEKALNLRFHDFDDVHHRIAYRYKEHATMMIVILFYQN